MIKAKTPVVSVTINDTTVNMIVDTGASTDILDENTYGKVNHLKTIYSLQQNVYLHTDPNNSLKC